MKKVLERLLALRREEEGQSLVFGVISVFLVLFFGAMVLGVGRVTARRIQMQFAADAAAFSAATTESECLNALTVLNTAMAQVRARSLRYLTDAHSYGVLTEMRSRLQELETEQEQLEEEIADLEEQIAPLEQQLAAATNPATIEQLENQIDGIQAQIERNQTRLDALNSMITGEIPTTVLGDDPEWVREIVGINRADMKYNADPDGEDAYHRAETWLRGAGEWMRELSRLEHTIAILAPYLSSETAYKVAQENGAEYVSMFPSSRWLPREDDYLWVTVERQGEHSWYVVGGDGTELWVRREPCSECGDCAGCGDCQMCWDIEWNRGAEHGHYMICQMWDPEETDNRIWYADDLTDSDPGACIQQTEDFYITTWGPEGVDVIRHEEHDPVWLEIINTEGEYPDNTLFVRRVGGSGEGGRHWDEEEGVWVEDGPPTGGVIEIAHPQWDAEAGEWVDPEEEDFAPLPSPDISMDGVDVSINLDPVIPLPGSARVRVLDPPYISLRDGNDEEWGRAFLRDHTWFTATINSVGIDVREDDQRQGATLRKRGDSFRTENATGRWRTHFDRREEYWWQHRLTEEIPGTRWFYEYQEFGARLQHESNMARLTGVPAADFPTASWMGYRDPGDAALTDNWADSRDLPPWAYEPDMQTDGWLDVRTATARDASDADEYTYTADGHTYQIELFDEESGVNYKKYHQVRACWDPLCENGTYPGLDVDPPDGEDDDCNTCDGNGYVVLSPNEVEDWPPEGLNLSFLSEYRPLVLTEDFFKYGLTVGVWHRRESHFPEGHTGETPDRPVEYLLHDPNPGFKGMMEGPQDQTARQRGEILRPAWGYFAVAAARTRMVQGDDPIESGALEDGMYFSESAVEADQREEWIESNMNNLYLRRDDGHWTTWDTRLIPLNRQVLNHDIVLDQEDPVESGVGWLMRRIAYGSPGGREATRQSNLPAWYGYGDRHGHVAGWTHNMYGRYDQSYPPEWVRQDLLQEMRPRRRATGVGSPYTDAEGRHRDPFVEQLGTRDQGTRRTGGQFDYNTLDEEDVVH